MLATNVFNNEPGDVANPTFAEIVLKGTITQSGGLSASVVNILHFARLSGLGTDDENDLLGAVFGLPWFAAYLAAITDQLSFASYSCRFMDDVTRPAVVNTTGWVGAISTDRQPSFVTVGIQKQGYARGRSYRGRISLAGIVEADTTGNRFSTGGATTWNAINTDLQDLISFSGVVDTWGMVVISQTLSNVITNPTTFTGSRVLSLILNPTLGTMLRRKEGRGS